ncbi:MAG: hypothetical protein KDK36_09915 [Leptospiraceae bacterium]|nr:hypothetical protein [Leptospiraceae bacterium]
MPVDYYRYDFKSNFKRGSNENYKLNFIYILLLFFNCQNVEDSSGNSLLLLLNRINRASVSGTAAKGAMRNSLVTVYPVSNSGYCDTSKVLGTSYTDSSGNYSVEFSKTGGLVCVKVGPHPDLVSLLRIILILL